MVMLIYVEPLVQAQKKHKRPWRQHNVKYLKAKYYIQQLPHVKIIDGAEILIDLVWFFSETRSISIINQNRY
jgi:hypothetical protein